MALLGYFLSVLIGVILGLIGGGGSILTVPLLVYVFKTGTVQATAYSLFIVGLTSAVGSVAYFRAGLVNMRIAILFGIPSVVAVFLTRALLVPAIPDLIVTINEWKLTKSILLLGLFALLMIAASYSMIKKNGTKEQKTAAAGWKFNYPLILAEGVIVGLLTGLVGAGGGFLIIPALVLLSGLEMKEAVGTSLVIIAFKSLIGFLGESDQTAIQWPFILLISTLSVMGILIGTLLSKRIDGNRLKPAFGWFVLFMGIYILIKEIFA